MDGENFEDGSQTWENSDVNGDGMLNILDIVIIANIILGAAESVPEADVNEDGQLNILDIVTLANMILD